MKSAHTIISTCAAVMHVSVDDILKPWPRRHGMLAKQLAAWFMRKDSYTFNEIAEALKMKSHVSAINAVVKIDKLKDNDSWTRDHINIVKSRLSKE